MQLTTALRMALFDSDFLKKLEYLSLVSRRVFRGQLLAQRRTMQLGGGSSSPTIASTRPATTSATSTGTSSPGTTSCLLKRFQEEEDLHVYLLLDCSRSMAFGDPVKFDYARQVAAALAYIALADLDRVAVVAFAGDIVADFPLTRGKARILSLLKFLEGLEPQGTVTDLARVVTNFVHRGQRRGLAVVLSDLFDPKGFRARARPAAAPSLRAARRPDLRPPRGRARASRGTSSCSTSRPGRSGRSRSPSGTCGSTARSSPTSWSRSALLQHLRDRRHAVATEIPFDELLLRMMRAAGALA